MSSLAHPIFCYLLVCGCYMYRLKLGSLEQDGMTGDMLRHLSGPAEAIPRCEKQTEGDESRNGSIRMLKVCHFKHSQFKGVSDR
jgi:hypothetical protein